MRQELQGGENRSEWERICIQFTYTGWGLISAEEEDFKCLSWESTSRRCFGTKFQIYEAVGKKIPKQKQNSERQGGIQMYPHKYEEQVCEWVCLQLSDDFTWHGGWATKVDISLFCHLKRDLPCQVVSRRHEAYKFCVLFSAAANLRDTNVLLCQPQFLGLSPDFTLGK